MKINLCKKKPKCLGLKIWGLMYSYLSQSWHNGKIWDVVRFLGLKPYCQPSDKNKEIFNEEFVHSNSCFSEDIN